MPQVIDAVGVGPTGLQCAPQKAPGGEYSILYGSCLAGTALVSGQVSNSGRLACAGGIRLPEEGNTLGPWVAVMFEGSGSTITVGNNSSPATNPQNVACIQRFEFGHSDGLTMKCTIQDEQGGSFVQFMQNLLKDYTCLKKGSPAAVRMKFQFGWVKSSCGTPIPLAASRCFYCLSDSVETNFNQGKIIFDITGKDLCARMFEGGCSQAYGGEGQNAIPITQAIRDFMTTGCSPNIGSVRFCRMQGGDCWPCPFKEGGVEGPRGKWACNGFNKLDVVLSWLKGHVTDRDKGWIPQYNCEVPNGELIFWEDSKPITPEADWMWNQNCIGTFLVNAGKRSNVIEFSPKIRWDFSRLTNNGGQLDSRSINATGEPGSRLPGMREYGLDAAGNPCVGQVTQAVSSETHKDLGTNTKGAVEGGNATNRALKILHDNIEADLTIIGDPTLLPPSEAMWSKNCTIIVINPYYLKTDKSSLSGLEWLAQPMCNEVLSSKAWTCKSVTHKIELGKYTTTIGVYMAAPGIDMKPGAPIGNWTGGWVPAPQC